MTQTDCVNDGKYIPANLSNFLGCTNSVNLVLEAVAFLAVFRFKEVGLKLDVTRSRGSCNQSHAKVMTEWVF